MLLRLALSQYHDNVTIVRQSLNDIVCVRDECMMKVYK
jgi:hypothetical protein